MLPSKAALEPSLQVSKWQKCPLLLDREEMEDLLQTLSPFYFVQTSGILIPHQEIVTPEHFLEVYTDYVEALKNGKLPDEKIIRHFFSLVMTNHLDALYTVALSPTQELVKVQHPVLQLQSHRFDYSFADGKFRSMVLGSQSILWGILFSYPQLYQDAHFQVFPIQETPQFPNTTLFKKLQRWMRIHTIATPFEVEGKIVNVPIRLGKKCLEWINHHPQLQAKNLRVIANKQDK
jgi:hypothetical protein